MLVLLRVLFGAALLYELIEGAKAAPATIPQAGDLTGAFYLVVCVGLGILNALVWAPYFGTAVSGPLTGMITESTYVERTNWVLRLVRALENRAWRRTTVALCFLEGIRHPSSPTPFVVGLRNAKPGSWFEKVYAREVFRFNNTQNCVQAFLALKRHGIDPRPHPHQEVNIMLLSLERPPRPEASTIAVPQSPMLPPLKRNPRIRLFKGQDSQPPNREEERPQPITAESAQSDSVHPNPMAENTPTGEPRGLAGWISNWTARLSAFLRAQ